MKKMIVILFSLTACLLLASCKSETAQNDVETEEVPVDYGNGIIAAREEFDRLFAEFEEIEITQTATMVRTDDSDRLIVQFTYSSCNGDGVYGFEMEKTAADSYDMIRHGENVTIESLVKDQ